MPVPADTAEPRLRSNLRWAVGGNVVGLAISFAVTFVVPKVIGVEQFGSWQLFNLLTTYAFVLGLGWNEGVLQNYAGLARADVPDRKLRGQAVLQASAMGVWALICLAAAASISDPVWKQVLLWTAPALVIVNLRLLALKALQAVADMKHATTGEVVNRVVFAIGVFGAVLAGAASAPTMALSYTAAALVSLVVMWRSSRDLFAGPAGPLRTAASQARSNVRRGLPVMSSDMLGTGVFAVIRIIVERAWGIAMFATVSLAYTVVSVLIMFVSSVGTSAFPFLRRMGDRFTKLYGSMSDLGGILTFALWGTFPLVGAVLTWWLPEFGPLWVSLALLYPAAIYEVRSALYIGPAAKTWHRERSMFTTSLWAAAAGVCVTAVGVVVRSFEVAVAGMAIASCLRAVLLDHANRRLAGAPTRLLADLVEAATGAIVCVAVAIRTPDLQFDLALVAVVAAYLGLNGPKLWTLQRGLMR